MSPLLFSSVVRACGSCLQVQSRSRGAKESRSWEANRRSHLSGRSLGRRWAIPGLPDSSISRAGNLASEPGDAAPKKHKNNTIDPNMLLKTHEVTLQTKLKRTQNEANFDHQTRESSTKTELAGRFLISAAGLCPRNAAGFGIGPLGGLERRERIQKLAKQSQQGVENKGSHLRTCQRSGNLYENTGTYFK